MIDVFAEYRGGLEGTLELTPGTTYQITLDGRYALVEGSDHWLVYRSIEEFAREWRDVAPLTKGTPGSVVSEGPLT